MSKPITDRPPWRDPRPLAATTAMLACPAIAQAKPRVVVVGGGAGGATVAKYLRHGDDAIDVTLIEPNRSYVTPFTSNLYLGGLKSFETLSFGYEAIAARGVGMVFDSVDRDRPRRAAGAHRRRRAALLRPAGAVARHRFSLGRGPGLFAEVGRGDAARLPRRRAVQAAEAPARRASPTAR